MWGSLSWILIPVITSLSFSAAHKEPPLLFTDEIPKPSAGSQEALHRLLRAEELLSNNDGDIPLVPQGQDLVLNNDGEAPLVPYKNKSNRNLQATDGTRQRELSPILGPQTWIDDTCFDMDLDLPQSNSIPPDPHAAAGPNSVVAVVNVNIEARNKFGGVIFPNTRLATFFTTLSPTNVFDPKVIYDTHRDRFLVVCDDSDTNTVSNILLAVSKTSNPTTANTDSWYFFKINALMNVSPFNNQAWADYPGFAVDEEAIYITHNMFSTSGNQFQTALLWIVHKNPFYNDGTAPTVTVHDYIDDTGGIGFRLTHMPAMVRASGGIAPGVGTYLVGYSGLTLDDTDPAAAEGVQVIRVDDPLGTPTFTQQTAIVGNIDDTTLNMPDADQPDTSVLIQTNDRRTLDAVWVNNQIWVVTTVVVSGLATAGWIKLAASGGAASFTSAGFISGSDIGAGVGVHTYFPSIDANDDGIVAIGFSASGPTLYGSAFATVRDDPNDAAGVFGMGNPPDIVRLGVTSYEIDFGTNRVRWGDYTGMALDPINTNCFWAFNEWAAPDCPGFSGGDPGCWDTTIARLCYPALSGLPSVSESPSRSAIPTPQASLQPSAIPSAEASQSPSSPPSASMEPTVEPSQSSSPSQSPSSAPSASMVPSVVPTSLPTVQDLCRPLPSTPCSATGTVQMAHDLLGVTCHEICVKQNLVFLMQKLGWACGSCDQFAK